MKALVKEIEAVIGVWYKDGRTFYVKRSDQMENYPNVWSLLSIQFFPEELPDFTDLEATQKLLTKFVKDHINNSADIFLANLLDRVKSFASKIHDDMTMIVIKVH